MPQFRQPRRLNGCIEPQRSCPSRLRQRRPPRWIARQRHDRGRHVLRKVDPVNRVAANEARLVAWREESAARQARDFSKSRDPRLLKAIDALESREPSDDPLVVRLRERRVGQAWDHSMTRSARNSSDAGIDS
jgi:hypothetical protein